ncbi:MAG: polynucleotide adenylyltransferase [Opitutaceae bacterium]|nr:polynucleotide adenylyltransferase [Opitutaceae bacterium]
MQIPSIAQRLAEEAHAAHGRVILIGGTVRDQLAGVEPKDCDLEIYGIPEPQVEPLLYRVAENVQRVGRAFPVWKIFGNGQCQDEALDIALPRREQKTGPRHTDFSVIFDPFMEFAEAAARRDFTINAMGIDLLTGELLDPHGGRIDLAQHRLRHTSGHFAEDPLRVLRGMQFCARYELQASPATIALCQTLDPSHLPPERIWGEWTKLILKGRKPCAGLEFLRQCGWVNHFPELAALIGVPQSAEWHPEGDVWSHTLHCLDAYAGTRTGIAREDLIVGLAVLCHDFGKPATTLLDDGKWKAHGHEAAGEAPSRQFLSRMTDEADLIQEVAALVTRHMVPDNLYQLAQGGQGTDRAIRRLSTHVRLDRLARVVRSDHGGRPPLPKDAPAADWLAAEAARLGVTTRKPAPLMMGRDLLAAGASPGAHWGPVLKSIYSQQIDGLITTKDQALAEARQQLDAHRKLNQVETALQTSIERGPSL